VVNVDVDHGHALGAVHRLFVPFRPIAASTVAASSSTSARAGLKTQAWRA